MTEKMVQLSWALVVLALVVSCPSAGQAAKYKAVRRANGTTVYVKQKSVKDYVLLPVNLITAPFRRANKGKLDGFGKPMSQNQIQAPMTTSEVAKTAVCGVSSSVKRVFGFGASGQTATQGQTVIASQTASQPQSR